jgi:hypothetical protein
MKRTDAPQTDKGEALSGSVTRSDGPSQRSADGAKLTLPVLDRAMGADRPSTSGWPRAALLDLGIPLGVRYHRISY